MTEWNPNVFGEEYKRIEDLACCHCCSCVKIGLVKEWNGIFEGEEEWEKIEHFLIVVVVSRLIVLVMECNPNVFGEEYKRIEHLVVVVVVVSRLV